MIGKKLAVIIIAMLNFNDIGAQRETLTIKVVETSDVHGCFFPKDITGKSSVEGSMARVAHYLKKLRNDYGDNVILVDNGDILQGQPVTYYYNYVDTTKTNIAAQVLNYMHYDVANIGNHDIETGHRVYDKWIGETNCPILGANIINESKGDTYLTPYTILNKGGVRIAVLGMTTPAIPFWLNKNLWNNLVFNDIVENAKKWVEYIRRHENPHVLIMLLHSGWEGGIATSNYVENATKAVAEQVEGIDMLLFGHDHMPHCSYYQSPNGTVLCLNPSNNAKNVAEATIQLELSNGDLVEKTISGKLVDISTLEPDDDFVDYFMPQLNMVSKWADTPLGKFSKTISTRDSFFGSSPFTDLILNLQLTITGADIAFNAPLDFDKEIKEGYITIGDMFNLYKYENQLYVMKLSGREIRNHLEMSYDLWANTMKSPSDHLLKLKESSKNDSRCMEFANLLFNFDSAAGIDYEVDVTKPDGEKVKILKMSDGQLFDEDKYYKVAINSYRGNGGGELLTRGACIDKDSLENRIIWESQRDQRWYLMQEIKKKGTVEPKANNNWKFVPEKLTIPAAIRDRKILFGDTVGSK